MLHTLLLHGRQMCQEGDSATKAYEQRQTGKQVDSRHAPECIDAAEITALARLHGGT